MNRKSHSGCSSLFRELRVLWAAPPPSRDRIRSVPSSTRSTHLVRRLPGSDPAIRRNADLAAFKCQSHENLLRFPSSFSLSGCFQCSANTVQQGVSKLWCSSSGQWITSQRRTELVGWKRAGGCECCWVIESGQVVLECAALLCDIQPRGRDIFSLKLSEEQRNVILKFEMTYLRSSYS